MDPVSPEYFTSTGVYGWPDWLIVTVVILSLICAVVATVLVCELCFYQIPVDLDSTQKELAPSPSKTATDASV